MFFGGLRERHVTSNQFRNYLSAIQQDLHITLTNAFSTLRAVPLKGEPMKNITTRSSAVLALVAAMAIGIPAVAYASSPPSPSTNTTPADALGASFVTAQKALEVHLANRATQLKHLVA